MQLIDYRPGRKHLFTFMLPSWDGTLRKVFRNDLSAAMNFIVDSDLPKSDEPGGGPQRAVGNIKRLCWRYVREFAEQLGRRNV